VWWKTCILARAKIVLQAELDVRPPQLRIRAELIAFGFAVRADENLTQGVRAGVFGFLHAGIMQTAAFEDEAPELRELYAQSFNHLLMDYLDTDSFE